MARASRGRIAGIVTGWIFLVLGVVGLFLPFLQGILFLVIGLLILSAEYWWARRVILWLRTRFPVIDSAINHVHKKYGHLLGHSQEDKTGQEHSEVQK